MRRISGYISVLHRRALQFYNKSEEETGVTGVQYPYLFYLGRHEGCRQDEIAKHLHVNKSNVTRQLEKLKNAEMIEIRKDSEDERVCRVYLTEKGINLNEERRNLIDSLDKKALKGITAKEEKIASFVLATMIKNLTEEN